MRIKLEDYQTFTAQRLYRPESKKSHSYVQNVFLTLLNIINVDKIHYLSFILESFSI
jgi:hypothetical protein